MDSSTFRHIRNFFFIVLAQVLVFSQIHLWGYATAYVYLIFLIKLPRHTPVNTMLMWGFLSGIIVDMFGNTPGINAAAATAMCFARKPILAMFTHKGLPDDFIPNAKSLKLGSYLIYSGLCATLFYCILFAIEAFTVNNIVPLLISIGSSTLLTMIFVIVAEGFSRKKPQHERGQIQ